MRPQQSLGFSRAENLRPDYFKSFAHARYLTSRLGERPELQEALIRLKHFPCSAYDQDPNLCPIEKAEADIALQLFGAFKMSLLTLQPSGLHDMPCGLGEWL